MANSQKDIDLFAAEGAASVAPDRLKQILDMVKQIRLGDKKIAKLNEQIKTISDAINVLKLKTLPDAMKVAGFSEYVLTDGSKVRRVLFVSGGLPKTEPARSIAIDELKKAGGESLLRSDISISFGKGDEEEATKLFNELKRSKNSLNIVMEYGVHSASLTAWVKRALEEGGAKFDLEKLGLYSGNTIKIIPPKEKK